MISKLSTLRVVECARCVKEGEKTIATLWILPISHSVTRWLAHYGSCQGGINQMYVSRQVKSALKRSEKKARIVTVIY